MYVMVLNVFVYAHDALMLLLYYSKTLGRRYSLKVTVLGAAGWWLVHSAVRLPAIYLSDDYNLTVITILQNVVMLIYLLVFYGSSVVKKLLAYMLLLSVLGIGECATMLLAGNLFDMGSKPLELGSEFTAAGLLIGRPVAILSFYIAFQIWNILQRSIWVRGGRQWLCALLPLSQAFLFWYLNEAYIFKVKMLPAPVLLGVILGFAADIYMFFIFDRAQERENMEERLRLQEHLHEMEKLRYDRLCASMEETARLRHDFQNYLLALRAMPETDGPGKEDRDGFPAEDGKSEQTDKRKGEDSLCT